MIATASLNGFTAAPSGLSRCSEMIDRNRLLELITDDPKLAALWQVVQAQEDGDAAHGCAHLLRVAVSTLRFVPARFPVREAIAAALLHDLVNVPKDSPQRAKASELSAEKARPILAREGFSAAAIEGITEAIRDHSFSRGALPRTELAKALQDADRLEALGVIGVFRTIATGVRMGARFFDDGDPWACDRPLNDRQYTVDHFFQKLLLLPESKTTAAGKAAAQRRARFMVQLLSQLGEELGVPLPPARWALERAELGSE